MNDPMVTCLLGESLPPEGYKGPLMDTVGGEIVEHLAVNNRKESLFRFPTMRCGIYIDSAFMNGEGRGNGSKSSAYTSIKLKGRGFGKGFGFKEGDGIGFPTTDL
jgi:hypothetical protein